MKRSESFSSLLQSFFTDRLLRQRSASPNTVAAYRDTFRLLLGFAHRRLKKSPSDLALQDLSAAFVLDFLNHLEQDRGNTARSRNSRLAAVRSFFRYASFHRPDLAESIRQVLSIPSKRFERKLVGFLSLREVEALLAAPNQATRSGRRDHALLLLLIQAGLRVSELTGLRCKDVHLGTGAHVRCHGKGRKERAIPLTRQTRAVLSTWLRECRSQADDPLFPNARGASLSSDGVQYILKKHLSLARNKCASLRGKRVSPHVLRHTNAVQLLHSGVDRSVIALWLGHESLQSTHDYLDSDLAFKEKILQQAPPFRGRASRFRADDGLLAFLNSL